MRTINEKVSFKVACELEATIHIDAEMYTIIHISWFENLAKRHLDCDFVLFKDGTSWHDPNQRCALVYPRQEDDPSENKYTRMQKSWKRKNDYMETLNDEEFDKQVEVHDKHEKPN